MKPRIEVLVVGDRVRKHGRTDGSTTGTVVSIRSSRQPGLPVAKVKLDSSGREISRSVAYWERIR